ncbi:hypothetical protein DENSPDRAFT_632697 [Dentipellis sp. KUC8613]|nr:hypothetical protein DENSPDRAFT_632697 [Dentipellis sp. KUC8613]
MLPLTRLLTLGVGQDPVLVSPPFFFLRHSFMIGTSLHDRYHPIPVPSAFHFTSLHFLPFHSGSLPRTAYPYSLSPASLPFTVHRSSPAPSPSPPFHLSSILMAARGTIPSHPDHNPTQLFLFLFLRLFLMHSVVQYTTPARWSRRSRRPTFTSLPFGQSTSRPMECRMECGRRFQ